VSLLVDLCHAGAFSDLLPRSRRKRQRLEGFLGDVRATLMRTAQGQRKSARKAYS
jgi:hypothetical protein